VKERTRETPVYVISVAASLTGLHPRTLRIYEAKGLISPARTPKNIRLYSERDIQRVRMIRYLTQEKGLNLAGVKLLLEIQERAGEQAFAWILGQERTSLEQGEHPTGQGEEKS